MVWLKSVSAGISYLNEVAYISVRKTLGLGLEFAPKSSIIKVTRYGVTSCQVGRK